MSSNPLLTASLTAKVSNLKSLSEAYKELEKSKHQDKQPKLKINGISHFGTQLQTATREPDSSDHLDSESMNDYVD